ncbi:hypothetical protein H8959_000249 [Pygathrix nigripes]
MPPRASTASPQQTWAPTRPQRRAARHWMLLLCSQWPSRKDGKHLMLHELTVNEVAAQLCVKDNALLTRRDELFALARQISQEVTYKYTYRTTKSKCGERDELSL